MYLNLVQLAESFGVTEKVVQDWIANEGLPHTPDRGRLLFDRAQVTQWAAERGLATQAGFLANTTMPAFATGWQLEPLLRSGRVWRELAATDVPGALEKIVQALPGTTPPVRQMLAMRLKAPGGVTMAPVGGGFALPHPATRITLGRESGIVALLLLRDGLVLPEPPADGVPVTRLLFFIAPSPRSHLDLLGRLSRLISKGRLKEVLGRGGSDEDIFLAAGAMDAEAAGREANK
ncbi:MAG: PTS sugar transporter subunit IIA [Opitutae bacterium]|nr:PTS sugar transporter subunit IIA [Opitutae bacterium]